MKTITQTITYYLGLTVLIIIGLLLIIKSFNVQNFVL